MLLGQEAATRKMEYMLGTFADPIYFGDYPASVKQRVSVLHEITPELVRCCASARGLFDSAAAPCKVLHQGSFFVHVQAQALNGSCDYFALNHYSTT